MRHMWTDDMDEFCPMCAGEEETHNNPPGGET